MSQMSYWASPNYNENKVWPTNVLPRQVKVKVDQPTRTTTSQNQLKYASTSGVIKYHFELDYPPMTGAQFAPFRAAMELMQGQYNTCALPISILSYANEIPIADSVGVLDEELFPGDTLLSVTGLTASVTDAVVSGQFISIEHPSMPNGQLGVAANTASTDGTGAVLIRLTHPVRQVVPANRAVNIRPTYVIVSSNQDSIEYSVDVAKYHYLTVGFTATNWLNTPPNTGGANAGGVFGDEGGV